MIDIDGWETIHATGGVYRTRSWFLTMPRRRFFRDELLCTAPGHNAVIDLGGKPIADSASSTDVTTATDPFHPAIHSL